MLMIITCHFMQYLNIELAWWFNVGVQIFFTISGFLYGRKTVNNPIKFYKKSFKKILIPYWIFLLIVAVIQKILVPEVFSWGKTLFAFLCIGTLDGIEHLWFVPKILICYLLLPLFLLIRDEVLKMKTFKIVLSIVFVFVILQIVGFSLNGYALSANNINCFAVGVILSSVLARTKSLFKSTVLFSSLAIITNSLRVYFSYFLVIRNNAIYDLFVKYAHGLLGVALFLVLYNLFSNIKSNPVLRFSDKYSYHIYLVHQVFILGPLSLMTVTSNLLLNISIICCCILCSGLILKKINNFVDKILTVIKAKIIRKILINNRSLHLK